MVDSNSELIGYDTHSQYLCPKADDKRLCIPGPTNHAGECCCVTPDRQLNFSVNQRDTHHWDIYTNFGRAFRIRGQPGTVLVFDERRQHPDKFNPDRQNYVFRSVAQAMAWCAEELMYVRDVPSTDNTK